MFTQKSKDINKVAVRSKVVCLCVSMCVLAQLPGGATSVLPKFHWVYRHARVNAGTHTHTHKHAHAHTHRQKPGHGTGLATKRETEMGKQTESE